MRADWIGSDACKQHAKDLRESRTEETRSIRGLAVLSALQIRQLGAAIIDTREEFEGHADIKQGIISLRRGDPPPAEQLKILRDLEKALLAKLANDFPDPDPQTA